MFGWLNIDKPSGITSRDAVNRVERALRLQGISKPKAGHAGTLDPLAEGVLVVAIGKATRLIPYVQKMPKEYRGSFRLGCHSDTEDATGEVELLENAPAVDRAQLESVLAQFVGTISQMPPSYSALKVRGKRAYQLAREGKQVTLEARPVRIDRLELTEFCYPDFTVEVTCGGGTYIRSLGRDLARAVGSEAVMTALARTAVGPFRQGEACPYGRIESEWQSQLQSAVVAVSDLPAVELNAGELASLADGKPLVNRWQVEGEEVAGVDSDGQLVAILQARHETLQPRRYFG